MEGLKALKKPDRFKKKKALPPKQPKQEPRKEIMEFPNKVAMDVLQQALTRSENALCSPASISTALNMLAVGAENSTLQQLLNVLGYADIDQVNATSRILAGVLNVVSDDVDDEPYVSSVNALWLDQRFFLRTKFEEVLRDVHKAKARSVDFRNKPDEVAKEVNLWAEEETKGLIKQVLSREDIKPETMLLLVNALHFKVEWQYPFDQEYTRDDDFYLLSGDKVRVPFMTQVYNCFYYGKFQECQVIRMPYAGATSKTSFSMYIFLPNEKNGLPNLMKNIKIDRNMFKDKFRLEEICVDTLSIPIFSFEYRAYLKETMKQLGLTLPFDETCRDFSRMIDNLMNAAYVSDVIQKCRVETNEKGTEAAAVTIDEWEEDECGPDDDVPPRLQFVADHPFIFLIREDISGAILFVGTMLNPM